MDKTIYEIPIEKDSGEIINLTDYQGKVLLFVNVASRCGFTPQYKDLEQLQQQFKSQGFSVLGFPCNQFLKQEPGSNETIQHFAKSCFHVSFPIFAKVNVKGKGKSPIYNHLQKNLKKRPLIFTPWNFSKILVDQEGNVLKQYYPFTSFKKIQTDIQKLLQNH